MAVASVRLGCDGGERFLGAERQPIETYPRAFAHPSDARNFDLVRFCNRQTGRLSLRGVARHVPPASSRSGEAGRLPAARGNKNASALAPSA